MTSSSAAVAPSLFDYLTARGLGFTTLCTDSVFAKQFAWANALFVRRPAGA